MKRISLTTITFVINIVISPFYWSQGTGLNFDEKAYNSIPEVEKPLGFGENLKPAHSLRKYLPAVGNQGSFGTCVGWSSTYYGATAEYARLKGIENTSEITAFAFDPYYTFLNITSEKNYFSCTEGTLISDASAHLVKKGVKRFLFNTLECGARIDEANKPENSPIKITDYRRVLSVNLSKEENLATIKQAISDGHPVIIGMALPKSFYAIDKSGVFVPEATEKNFTADYGGHAMTVVGYDDERLGGTFEIVNSWGAQWGDQGFLYVKYNDFIDFTRMAVCFESELVKETAISGCVLGNCLSGYGSIIMEGGDRYEGNFFNGEAVGYGLYYWKSDNSFFGGEWEASVRHGKGSYYKATGEKIQGYWKQDAFVQDEIVINSVLHKNSAQDFVKNLPFMSTSELSQALQIKDNVDSLAAKLPQGCVYGDCKDGVGLLLAVNYIYFGSFQSGSRHGYGEMRWIGESWGNAFVGNSIVNTRSGIGAYFWPNGNRYYGEWKDGNREGIGTLFLNDGQIQAGRFSLNTFEGEGLGFGAVKLDMPLDDPKIEKVEGDNKRAHVTAPMPSSVKKKKKKN